MVSLPFKVRVQRRTMDGDSRSKLWSRNCWISLACCFLLPVATLDVGSRPAT